MIKINHIGCVYIKIILMLIDVNVAGEVMSD
jgi:hypothetical protein